MTSAEGPVAAAFGRMRDSGITPNRELGQNFLVDANLLDVVSREAEAGEQDVALEVGGGLGILSEHLAPKVAHLHVVEVDRALEEPLRMAVEPFGNVTLHFADALQLDLGALEPPPTKMIANLPYGIAAPLILDSIVALPSCATWVAMVQREVGERLAAPPGSKAYGVPSALAQSACRVKVVRPVSRNVFRPVPHVDSVIVRLDRTGPAAPPEVRKLIAESFAHRRKALPKSVALASGDPSVRDRLRDALEALGLPADSRAEQLSAEQFSQLADEVPR
ncbi:MAG: 16S rRNA (adenine(1518)-N(6)/adenine(1519)-N(6))-dimethyltransferase RsmA [Actinomycetes bacterium]